MGDNSKKKKETKAPQPLSVKLTSTENGGKANEYIGPTAPGKAKPLGAFSQAVQERLKNATVNTVVSCAPMSPVDISKLVPIDAPALAPAGPPARHHANAGPRHQAPTQNPVAAAPVFHDNPYNFAEWQGDAPWLPADEEAQAATHQRWREGRHSGVLHLMLTAQTPIFVPEGRPNRRGEQDRTTQDFWRCHDTDGMERHAIPGSTLKGVVRTLFETLTNSRLGVVSEDIYEFPIPYRRRSATLFVVEAPPVPGADVVLRQCEVEFVVRGQMLRRSRQGQPEPWIPPGPTVRPTNGRVVPTDTVNWQEVPYRANLLVVRPNEHTHRWKRLFVRVTNHTVRIAYGDLERYRSNLSHPLYERTLDQSAADPQRNKYLPGAVINTHSQIQDAKRMDAGELIFGIPDPGRARYLACFGKNINFLWPSAQAPKRLVGCFYPRPESQMSLAGADHADLLFGFAGANTGRSHPFRGRVRFTTFWGPLPATNPPGEIQLRPLTSPTGTKLKARSLYLPPGAADATQTYDQATRLRGRKFYWHQKAAGDGVNPGHQQPGADNNQLPAPIRPLPKDTTFSGRVVFEDLSTVELGALLAAVCPDLLFGATASTYGLKIGKGKPRGLGSVSTSVTLTLRGPARDDYSALRSSGKTDGNLTTRAVAAYRAWLGTHGQGWDQVDFVRDLRTLLLLPGDPVFKRYLDAPLPYGWLPDFYVPGGPAARRAATGDPAGQVGVAGKYKPPAMKRA